MHVRCPHCRNPIEIVDDEATLDDVTCPSCGSNISLVGSVESTRSYHGPSHETIAHFQLIERLGMGAFGAVWKARDTELDRHVAVKIPRKGQLDSAEAEKFLREARAAAQLKHPNIVGVHEVGRSEESLYIVSDLIDGVTLTDWLTGHRPTPREAAELCAKIAAALEHAHGQGVVHRDLKPSNILIDGDGEPHLTDFGLAKRSSGEVTMTVDGQVLGTPAYMAPEQARGEAHRAGPLADVYSLGVVLFEMLTGERPFRGNSRMLMHQVINEDAPAARSLSGNVPRDLETVCAKCLEKEPARRYASARALADELQRYLDGRPIVARPVGRLEKARRWCRRNPLAAALSGVALLLLVCLAVGGVTASVIMRAQRDEAKQQRAAAMQAQAAEAQERQKTTAALAREAAARQQSDRRLAEVYLEKGRSLCTSGNVGLGMHWFARSLDTLPPGSAELEQAARWSLSLWRGSMLSLRGCLAHQSQVSVVQFSDDGDVLLTGSYDRTARLWDAQTGEPLGPPLNHPHQVECAAVLKDATTVVTGCYDGRVRVFNGRTGAAIGEPLDTGTLVREIQVHFDGQLAAARNADGDVMLFDPQTGAAADDQLAAPGRVSTLAFSPDGALLVTGSIRPPAARLWEVETGQPVGDAIPHAQGVSLVAFSPAGDLFVTVADVVRTWNPNDGLASGPPLKQSGVTSVAFRPDGRVLAAAGVDKHCVLWRVPEGGLIAPPIQHPGQVPHVAFSPDGKTLLTSSGSVARLWDASTGEPLGQPLRDAGQIAISPDGQTVATGSYDKTARLWAVDGGVQPVRTLKHNDLIRDAAFSPSGDRVVVGVQNGLSHLWDTAAGKRIGSVLRSQQPVAAVTFHPGGDRIAVGSWDGVARMLNAESTVPVGQVMRHDGAIHALAFSADGRRLFTAGDDKTVRVWDADSGAMIRAMPQPAAVRAIAVSPDGKGVLAASWSDTAHFWDTETGQQGHALKHAGAQSVGPVAISPDGNTLLTADDRGVVRLWAADSGKPLSKPLQHDKSLTSAAFSADGSMLLTAGYDQTARLWNVATGKPIGPAMRHDDAIMGAALSANGELVLTGSGDGVARIWQARTGIPLGPALRHRGEVSVVAFRPDGAGFLSGSGTARLTDLELLSGTNRQLGVWVDVVTGMELREDGQVEMLGADAWLQRREELRQLGGAPGRNTIWPLWRLIDPQYDETGAFGRAFSAANP